MEPFLSNAIHVTAALGVFTALGAICLGGAGGKGASMLHGISLILLLLVGLHMLMSRELVASGGWWHAKIVLWLVLGAAPALAKRKVLPAGVLLGICLAAGAAAAYLGLAKPF